MLHAPRVAISWIVLLLRFSSDFLKEYFLTNENLSKPSYREKIARLAEHNSTINELKNFPVGFQQLIHDCRNILLFSFGEFTYECHHFRLKVNRNIEDGILAVKLAPSPLEKSYSFFMPNPLILVFFPPVCFLGRYDPDMDGIPFFLPKCMAHNEKNPILGYADCHPSFFGIAVHYKE
jgi:hypothetical protein